MELSQERKEKFLPRKTRLVMGVDLGQIKDPTAIAVIEFCDGLNDYGSEYAGRVRLLHSACRNRRNVGAVCTSTGFR